MLCFGGYRFVTGIICNIIVVMIVARVPVVYILGAFLSPPPLPLPSNIPL